MKRVYFVRHAKSSWSNPGLSDHDRPLNPRGHHDAPLMGKYVASLEYKPQLLLSSTAVRAKTTAEYFREALNLPSDKLNTSKELYHSYPETWEEHLFPLHDELACVALFAHNPGMTMGCSLVSEEYVDNVPTCGVFLVKCDVPRWTEFSLEDCQLELFLKPKELFY